MSYLICLYVYYHGNNLSAFGYTPGSRDSTGPLNTGLSRSAKDYEGLLPDEIVQSMKQSEKMAAANDYERLLKEAIAESQDYTKQIANSSLNINIGTSKPEDFDLNDDTGVIGMDFFDELNGIGSYRRYSDY